MSVSSPELSPEALRLKVEFLSGDNNNFEARVSAIADPVYQPRDFAPPDIVKRLLHPHLPFSASSNLETSFDVAAPHTDPTRPDYLKILI